MATLQVLAAFGLSMAFMLLLWSLKGFLLKPVKPQKDLKVMVLITANEAASGLEQEVKSLRWLKNDGRLDAELIIVDTGMDAEAAKAAALLSRDDPSVKLCRPEEIENTIIRSDDNGGKN